jgi:hypothetical protein
MELRPYDIELLRGKVQRAATEETVIIKAELLTELLNRYEDSTATATLDEYKEALDAAEMEIQRLQDELDKA